MPRVVLTYQDFDVPLNRYLPVTRLEVELHPKVGGAPVVLPENADDGYYINNAVDAGSYEIWDDTGGVLAYSGKDIIVSETDTHGLMDLAVTTAKIANGAVTTAKLANTAVDNTKIAIEAVSNDNIQLKTIRDDRIADDTIIEDLLADLCVSTDKLQDEAVTADKIYENTITLQKLALSIQQELQYLRALIDTVADTEDYTIDHYEIDLETGSHTNTIFLRKGLQVVALDANGIYVAPQVVIVTTHMIAAYVKGVVDVESGASYTLRIQALHNIVLDEDISTHLPAAVTFDMQVSITPVETPPANVFLQNLDLYIVRKP